MSYGNKTWQEWFENRSGDPRRLAGTKVPKYVGESNIIGH